ncbi:MAG: DUF6320 domain-containing protein [Thermotogota bacterium]
MPYCPKCGIEVDNGVKKCPLCGFGIPVIDYKEKKEFKKYPDKINRYPKSYRRKRKIFMSYYRFMVLILSIILLVEDFVFTGAITWSKYVVAPLFSTIYMLHFIMGLSRGFHRGLLTIHLDILALNFLLDIFDGSLDFTFTLALPILFITYIGLEVFFFIFKKTRKFGLDSIAYILIFLAFLSIGLEFIIELNVYSIIDLNWSLITLFQLIPIAFLFILLHYKSTENFKRKIKLFFEKIKRKFHT